MTPQIWLENIALPLQPNSLDNLIESNAGFKAIDILTLEEPLLSHKSLLMAVIQFLSWYIVSFNLQ